MLFYCLVVTQSRQLCPHVLICGQDIKCPKKVKQMCEIVETSPGANTVAGMAGVQLCAAVSYHSCSTGLKITKTCYIVFLSMPKATGLKAGQSSTAL